MSITEEERAHARHFTEMCERIQGKRIELTDSEWMSIIVRDRDGLPACCANISALRDVVISLAREDGEIGYLHDQVLARALTWCFPDHEVPSPEIQKIIDQLGWEPFAHHVRNEHEG